MATILFCPKCFKGIRHQGGDLPRVCPRCKQATTEWFISSDSEPNYAYLLTWNDRQFLRSIKIAVDCLTD